MSKVVTIAILTMSSIPMLTTTLNNTVNLTIPESEGCIPKANTHPNNKNRSKKQQKQCKRLKD